MEAAVLPKEKSATSVAGHDDASSSSVESVEDIAQDIVKESVGEDEPQELWKQRPQPVEEEEEEESFELIDSQDVLRKRRRRMGRRRGSADCRGGLLWRATKASPIRPCKIHVIMALF